MRGSIPFFTGMQGRFGLEYGCLVDLEPSFNEDGRQQVYIGSVGKTMPAVLVQGREGTCGGLLPRIERNRGPGGNVPAHGAGPRIFRTMGRGEPCPPPTWFNLRDRKEGYDVSVPYRAAGYMSMLGFGKTADSVMGRLRRLGGRHFPLIWNGWRPGRQRLRSGAVLPDVDLSCCVMEYGELVRLCHERHGEEAGTLVQGAV